MDKKLQQSHPANYNILIAQDLWQAYCQNLLIILRKELDMNWSNLEMDMVINNAKREELNKKIVSAYTIIKDDLILYKFLCCNKNYQKKV